MDDGIGQTIVLEIVRSRLILANAAVGAYPHPLPAVLVNGLDEVLVERAGIIRLVEIIGDGVAVVARQPVARAYPQHAFVILHQGTYLLVGKPIAAGNMHEAVTGIRHCHPGTQQEEQSAAASTLYHK